MVEIPTPPERGCGRLIYVWPYCSCVEHREESIPCARFLVIVHAQDVHDHPVDDLNLAIRLEVEGSGFGELGLQK